jgi:hypothetical protein
MEIKMKIKQVLSYGVVGLLAVALLAGTGYILLSSTQAQAEQGPLGSQGQVRALGRDGTWQDDTGVEDGAAYGRGRGRRSAGSEVGVADQDTYGHSETMQGYGAFGGGTLGAEGAFDGRGRNSGTGQGRNETVRSVDWETLTGKVTGVDGDVTVETAEGEVLVGLGQASYREGFALKVGDEVSVTGFHEDREFKAGTVENLTTGQTLVLRDETGRPMWSGQGRLKNQG